MNSFKIYFLFVCMSILSGCSAEGDSGTTSGQSGSLASMVVADGQLHILNNDYVKSFELSGGVNIQETHTSEFFWQAETLTNYQNEYLLVGSDTGVIVYDFNNQQTLSTVNHIEALDPVIANGITGYFTTRDGNEMTISPFEQDTVNIIDLSDLENATLVFTSEVLSEPVGLALYGDELLVCDKATGLARFDIVQDEGEVASELIYVSSNFDLPCNDIIVKDDILILTNSIGVTQVTMINGEFTILSEIN